jgi:uncharacterized membrane-anchored protein
MEEELILGEPERDGLDIIDNQLIVISSVSDLDDSLYDKLAEDKVKAVVNAMKIILKVQANILKTL